VYEYNQLKKGIVCENCDGFMRMASTRSLLCSKCGTLELAESVVIRSVSEFNLLFPDDKITVGLIHEWCDGVVSKVIITRILLKQLVLVNKVTYSYYSSYFLLIKENTLIIVLQSDKIVTVFGRC